MPPAWPRAQGWTGKCKTGHCRFLAGVRGHPLAVGQDRPSRPGPTGEGRSASRVLHLPRGAKPATRRVADGERMNPRKERAFAQIKKTSLSRLSHRLTGRHGICLILDGLRIDPDLGSRTHADTLNDRPETMDQMASMCAVRDIREMSPVPAIDASTFCLPRDGGRLIAVLVLKTASRG
jgi:hypothetical protein